MKFLTLSGLFLFFIFEQIVAVEVKPRQVDQRPASPGTNDDNMPDEIIESDKDVAEELEPLTQGLPTLEPEVLYPSPSLDSGLGMRKRGGKAKKERELDSLGGNNLFHWSYGRYIRDADNGGARVHEKTGSRKRRSLDTLGGMQLHDYYKRAFDSLGGANLHGGYKRSQSPMDYEGFIENKRFDNLGGSNLHYYKRYPYSIDGNIYEYKRTPSISPWDDTINSGYKRFLSSLGGTNIYNYKRSVDPLGGSNLHTGYKRFLSSLGGTNIHSGRGFKRTLSSLGGMNIHGGY